MEFSELEMSGKLEVLQDWCTELIGYLEGECIGTEDIKLAYETFTGKAATEGFPSCSFELESTLRALLPCIKAYADMSEKSVEVYVDNIYKNLAKVRLITNGHTEF